MVVLGADPAAGAADGPDAGAADGAGDATAVGAGEGADDGAGEAAGAGAGDVADDCAGGGVGSGSAPATLSDAAQAARTSPATANRATTGTDVNLMDPKGTGTNGPFHLTPTFGSNSSFRPRIG
jgi:hypothetical protein